jgi:hypothetical protein
VAHQPIGIRTDFIESILEPLFLTWYLDRLKSSTMRGFPSTSAGQWNIILFESQT